MKQFLVGLALFLFSIAASNAEKLAHLSDEALIDRLADIDAFAPGLSGGATYDAFIGDDSQIQFQAGLLGVPPPVVPEAMRELVRRGAEAVPKLIAHLDDQRVTKLAVGDPEKTTSQRQFAFSSKLFATEYDARDRSKSIKGISLRADSNGELSLADPSFDGAYTIKIADVCYVLIGEIVGRQLNAVRYMPSGILMVNSPIQRPNLVKWIRADWDDLTPDGLKGSLLNDIHSGSDTLEIAPAMQRLRFYFPAAYRALSGADSTKRVSFEVEEKKRKMRR